MSARLRSLLEKRNQKIVAARAITEAAEADGGRALNAEETRNFEQAIADQDALRVQSEGEQRLVQLEGELASTRGQSLNGADDQRGRPGAGQPGTQESRTIGAGRYAVRLDDLDDADVQRMQRRASSEYRQNFGHFIRTGEKRSLDTGSGAAGGYTVAPLAMAQGILQAADDQNFIRQKATVFSVPNATSMGKVTLDADPADLDWTEELATGNEDTSMAFGQRELTPHAMAKLMKFSNKLLRISGFDIMGLAMQRLGYKKALTEEKAFMTGDGNKKALGLFTASADGIPTSRDFSTGNTSTAITNDGLIGARYNTKTVYQKEWLFSRTAVGNIAKLRDDSGAGAGTGGYIWQPSQQLGQPDRLHGLALNISENVPATFTTGLYVGMIGDFSYYWIVDALEMQVQRLLELYARTNQVGLILRSETDGQPVLAEAFTRIKLG